jgi:hypothetical protein
VIDFLIVRRSHGSGGSRTRQIERVIVNGALVGGGRG